MGLVFLLDENGLTGNTADARVKKIISVCNDRFYNPDPKKNFHISFAGDATVKGAPVRPSLDSQFLAEDVALLAFSIYEDSIKDGSFFRDESLFKKYFLHTRDVIDLFKRMHLI